MSQPISLFWFRRDLRLHDNAGLYHALRKGDPVLPIFIFDTNILDELEDKSDKRLQFIHDALTHIQEQLVKKGSTLYVLHDTPINAFKKLVEEFNVSSVYTNHDYEPYADARDKEMKAFFTEQGIQFSSFKDQVIFERDEIVKDNKEPYTVYTPYSRKWREKLNDFYVKPYPVEKYLKNLYQSKPKHLPSLKQIGFSEVEWGNIPAHLDKKIAANYDKTRDFPAIHGTTRMSVHLRFGTVSIRQLVTEALVLNATFLNELIWREFYQMILWQFPHVINRSFKPAYDNIEWRNNDQEFARWCAGETGYPIVDAGMRQLNETGFMHNRVRMIVASFLTKHLLIDWRWGEAYFAVKLLDYDLAANNGGWQWAAGCGCDAAPYFRVFNPYLQTEKFDPQLKYIKQWIPDYKEGEYIQPIVDHPFARQRYLEVVKRALQKAE